MGANSLKHILNRDITITEPARQDGSAIHEYRRDVEPRHGHHDPGQRFIASSQPDHGIIAMPPHGQLNGIGDNLTADEG